MKQARPLSTRWRNALDEIAARHGFTFAALRIHNRTKGRFEARLECYEYLAAEGWSTPQIGDLFNRDHSTVCYALDRQGQRERKMERMRALKAKGAAREQNPSTRR